MPPAETFWGTILGSIAVATILAFIGLYKVNVGSPKSQAHNPQHLFEILVVALTIGVVGGGVAGLVIFALMRAWNR
jgi:heme/copper-type cytochrome/quinol oxidase subunit 2